MSVIEKGKKRLIKKSYLQPAFKERSVLLKDATNHLEQTCKAFAIEELEEVARALVGKSVYQPDVPGDFIDTWDAEEWIVNRIKSLKGDEHKSKEYRQ